MATFLTPHFSLEELSMTQQRGLHNRPPPSVVERLRATAEQLEAVRSLLGDRPLTVTSGYRSPAVNQAVGGAPRSAHMKGWAVDFSCHRFGSALDVCRAIAASSIPFDQLIEEGSWVHLSIDPRRRRQVLTKARFGYEAGLRAAATRART